MLAHTPQTDLAMDDSPLSVYKDAGHLISPQPPHFNPAAPPSSPESPCMAPLLCTRGEEEETLARICREEDANAVNLNPIRLLFLLACTSLTCRDLTPPSILIQEHRSVDLVEHLVRPSPTWTRKILPGVLTGRPDHRRDRRAAPRRPDPSPSPGEAPR
jgi:hypothetical protein